MLAWPLQGHCKAAARSVVYELNRGRFMLNGLNHLFISHGSDGSMYHMGNLVITKIFFGIVKENKWSFCELIILKVFHDLFCKITKKNNFNVNKFQEQLIPFETILVHNWLYVFYFGNPWNVFIFSNQMYSDIDFFVYFRYIL